MPSRREVKHGAPDRPILRAGFVLLLLSLLTGVAIPITANPKLALASHLTGYLGALSLMVLAAVWPALSRRARPAKLIRYCFVSAAYANWAASALGSVWGTSHFTPLSGAAAFGRRRGRRLWLAPCKWDKLSSLSSAPAWRSTRWVRFVARAGAPSVP